MKMDLSQLVSACYNNLMRLASFVLIDLVCAGFYSASDGQ